MQQRVVIFALVLYAAFAFRPILELPIFSRTLNLSPGDMVTILLVLGLFLKALLQRRKTVVIEKPPAVIHFLFAYILLAVVFLLPTLLFFVLHNELATALPRSLFNYLLWAIALVLFYYGSDSQLKINELRQIVWLLMVAFFAGVMGNLLLANSNLSSLIADTLTSQDSRLTGQIGDPNELGSLAAFFVVLGLMGALHEKQIRAQITFFFLALGTGLILLLTQSREALLTVVVAVLCICILLARTKQYRKAFVVLSGLAIGSFFSVINIPRIAETLLALDVGNTGAALSARDQVWGSMFHIISTQPLGVGFETAYLLTNNTAQQAHNTIMQSALVAGFLGVIAFFFFIVFFIKLLWDQGKLAPENWMIEAYFVFSVGYLATSMVSDHFISFFTFNAIFFGLLGFVACTR